MWPRPLHAVLLLALSVPSTLSQSPTARITGDVVPGRQWQQTSPESVGYASAKLEVLRSWLRTQKTGSLLFIVQGRVVFSYGDVTHPSKIASARKSVLAMLYGKYVANGIIDLDKTVVQLGLEDKQPFLPIEKGATLRQLLAARSGVYLPTGSLGQKDYLPPRGSEIPGAHYVYSNWDFDAAGVAFEKQTGQDIYAALHDDLVVPLGFEDYDPAKQVKEYTPESKHAEYVMRLSTRDMARLGLLMLDKGKWDGKQIIPADWVTYMTTLTTPFRDINPSGLRNYGFPARWGYSSALWWVWDEPAYPGNVYAGPYQGAFTAMGAGGTYITVFPAGDMIVVHQVDIDKDPGLITSPISPDGYMAILSIIGDSFCGDACP